MKSGFLVFQGYKLSVQILDAIEEQTIRKIFAYLQNHFDILSLQVSTKSILLYCGLYCQNEEPTHEILSFFTKHISHIIPPTIQVTPLSGYNFSLAFSKTQLKTYQETFQFYSIDKITIIERHSKIIKLILEIPNIVILIAYSNLNAKKFCFSLKLQSSTSVSLQKCQGKLIEGLKKTPYIKGNLSPITPKYVVNHQGQMLLGITNHHISHDITNTLLDLVPSIISPPSPPVIPKAFPQIILENSKQQNQIKLDQHSSNLPSSDKSSNPIMLNKFQKKPDNSKLTSNPLYSHLLDIFGDYQWEIVEIREYKNPVFSLVKIANHDFVIQLIFDLDDLTIHPDQLDLSQDPAILILCDPSEDLSSISSKWQISYFNSLWEKISVFS